MVIEIETLTSLGFGFGSVVFTMKEKRPRLEPRLRLSHFSRRRFLLVRGVGEHISSPLALLWDVAIPLEQIHIGSLPH